MKIQQIYHKKNELFEVEFYEDKECNISFDFTNAKDLYIQGNIATLMDLFATQEVDCEANIYIPYLTTTWNELCLQDLFSSPVKTLSDITPNLSKYIPEDNAVLFLDKESLLQNGDKIYSREYCYMEGDILQYLTAGLNTTLKTTIFLPHGTQSELQKANEVAKELKEKYGVEEVNVFVLHCFHYIYRTIYGILHYRDGANGDGDTHYIQFINKIITTNSTGILKPEDSKESLQVIDCKEIFEDYINGN